MGDGRPGVCRVPDCTAVKARTKTRRMTLSSGKLCDMVEARFLEHRLLLALTKGVEKVV